MIDLVLRFPQYFYIWTRAGNVFIRNLSTSACSIEICSACCFEIFVNFCCRIMFLYRFFGNLFTSQFRPYPQNEEDEISWIIIYILKYRNSTLK